MTFILNFLTLGLLPLYRRFLSNDEGDPRRCGQVTVHWQPFGNPSEGKLKKIMSHYFKGKELDYAVDTFSQGMCYVLDENVGEDLLDRLEKAGFNVDEEFVEECQGVIFNGSYYDYVSSLNYCNGCHRKGVRLFFDGVTSKEVYSCSSCGSTDTIKATALSVKEFNRHAKKFPDLPGPQQEGSSRRRSEEDSDSSRTLNLKW